MKSNIMFYDKKEDSIRCKLCPHNCILKENKFGVCNVRTVENNIGIAINYGEVTFANIDPIEKKPLYHYKPGKNILSVVLLLRLPAVFWAVKASISSRQSSKINR